MGPACTTTQLCPKIEVLGGGDSLPVIKGDLSGNVCSRAIFADPNLFICPRGCELFL